MNTRTPRDLNQIETKKRLEILVKDEKYWQEKVVLLAKQFSISDEEIKESNQENEEQIHHPKQSFCLRCKCNVCLNFRKLVIGIFGENKAYNDLWGKLRDIISSYYTLLTSEEESAVVEKKYENLLKESYGIRWSSDGSFDVKRNIHASIGNFTSTDNETNQQQIQTFIVVFSMLYTRDPHQLFELLCLQLTSIVLAYREGIKELTKCVDEDGKEFYKPEEFISYILNGYETITEVAENLSPLVSEMREHLEKFSLSWQLMNQCMYYRFLYVDIENLMAECIIRLKEAVDTDTYKFYVYKFIKFDEEMTNVSKIWETALIALEKYRKSPSEVSRGDRITMVNKIFEKIRHFDIKDEKLDIEKSLPLDWIVSIEKDDFWFGILDGIKHQETSHRMSDSQVCKCWACLMADGNNSDSKKKCLASESSECDVDESEVIEVKKYHLAWAVFKQLENHEPYTKAIVNPENFCVFNTPPCTNIECQVAANLIIGSYPLSFTKFLIKNYQPITDENDRRKYLTLPSQFMTQKFGMVKLGEEHVEERAEINRTFLEMNSFWEVEVDEDDYESYTDRELRKGLAAAMAENFKSDMKFPQRHIIFSYFHALFQIIDDDIAMDMEYLEKINMGKLFKGFGAISHEISSDSTQVDGIEETLKELKITAEMSADTNEALDLVQLSMKEVAEKLSSFSLAEDNDDTTKNALENEIKKPLVEALKLAASNKKLEAELKSLQKEHNMLKDMVKGLEQIHDDKKDGVIEVGAVTPTTHPPHTHTSTDIVEKENGGGSDCVCYYCTLFGKNQESNPRSTETRDRLRKRLHLIQNQKDHGKVKNLKNISFLLKNGKCSEKHVETSCCSQQQMKPQQPPSPPPPLKKIAPPTVVTPNPTPQPVKIKVETEFQRKKKTIQNKIVQTNKSEKVKIQRETLVNLDSVETLVEYIEGPSSKAAEEIRKAEEVAIKKQLKKQKQQQQLVRKQVDEYLQVIKKLNDVLHENAIELKQNQHRLQQLKSGKGKNFEPKRIKAAEGKISEIKSKKSKLEFEVKDILQQIDELNSDVDMTQECIELKYVITLIHPSGNIPTKPTKKVTEFIQPPTPPSPVIKIQEQPKPTQRPMMQPPKQQQQMNAKNSTANSDDDPAKRMVTIRRINLPHSEPQVTVTAKGSTPDDLDQLLYTFVNGQLVPATSLSQKSFQNGSIQLFMSSSNGQKKIVPTGEVVKRENLEVVSQPQKRDKAQKKEDKKRKKEEKKQQKLIEDQKKQEEKKLQAIAEKKLKADKKKQEAKLQLRQKKAAKKAFIDPEFAANPFTLLDDEGVSSSSSDDETSDMEVEDNVIVDIPTSNNVKENSNKKTTQLQQKNKTAKQTKSNDRKDSVTSVTSSNTSKDSKQSLKQQSRQIIKESKFPAPEMSVKTPPTIVQPVNSIMDQLNRGIRVEGLKLPPGITLTKVSSSDMSREKRDSINRITHPLSEVSSQSQNFIDHRYSSPNGNGLFMVETAPHAETATSKKKNKKKKNKSDESSQNNSSSNDRIVTLKNPMFYNNGNASGSNSEPMNAMMRNLQTPPFVSPMAPEPSQASIIKNENGMYTIRNPTFQNSFGNSSGNTAPSFVGMRPSSDSYPNPNEMNEPPKCSSVIGSEMKNMLQRRKEQEYAAMDAYYQHGMPQQQQQQQSSSSSSSYFDRNQNFDRNGTECDSFDGGFKSYPMMTNFDELRSGQMLNSEVTIHNVEESKMFQKRSPQQQTMFGDIISSRPMSNPTTLTSSTSAKSTNGGGDNWMHNSKTTVHQMLTEDYEKRQNSSHSNSPISVTSLEEIYDSDSRHQKLPSFYSAHHYNDDKSSGASSLFSGM